MGKRHDLTIHKKEINVVSKHKTNKCSWVIITIKIKILKIPDYKNYNKQYWREHCEQCITYTKCKLDSLSRIYLYPI